MSRQCSTCKTVSILPLDILYKPLEFNPPQYQCFQCKKVFTEEEYKNLDEGGRIPEIFFVKEEIEQYPIKYSKRLSISDKYFLHGFIHDYYNYLKEKKDIFFYVEGDISY